MTDLSYIIIRSKRRTLALIINEDATLEVRAPFKTSLEMIEKFINKKRSWIEQKKELVKTHRARILPKKFVDGEGFLYEGNTYIFQSSDCKSIEIFGVLHFPRELLPQARQRLIDWYKSKALEKIIDRTNYYSNITKLQYKAVKITNAKSSWGSCSYKGSLNISWRLIMAPPDILDYVIVHELVHLIEKNHSKSFWSKVQAILPGYKEHEVWLKQNGRALLVL